MTATAPCLAPACPALFLFQVPMSEAINNLTAFLSCSVYSSVPALDLVRTSHPESASCLRAFRPG